MPPRRSGSFPGNGTEVANVLSPRSSETGGLGVKMVEYVLGTSPTSKDLESRMIRGLVLVSRLLVSLISCWSLVLRCVSISFPDVKRQPYLYISTMSGFLFNLIESTRGEGQEGESVIVSSAHERLGRQLEWRTTPLDAHHVGKWPRRWW